MTVKHCEPEYSRNQQLMTCVHCAAPLSDNERVKELYIAYTSIGWAKMQLKVIADMLADRGDNYFAGELRRVCAGLKELDE